MAEDASTRSAGESNSRPHDYFATTRWTLVVKAGKAASPQATRALEELCRLYWYPLYAYVRRQGHAKPDAEDLTQAFFARFLQKNYLEGRSHEQGKFRAFLLACLKHFLANEWDKAKRLKRGGAAVVLSLDWERAENRYQLEPPDPTTSDRLYDREWAVTLLDQVLHRLQTECEVEGKGPLFARLKPFLMSGAGDIPYAQAAEQLGLSEGAVRVTVHRLRRRYRELLREEIAHTLSNPAQVEEELRSLFAAFAS